MTSRERDVRGLEADSRPFERVELQDHAAQWLRDLGSTAKWFLSKGDDDDDPSEDGGW